MYGYGGEAVRDWRLVVNARQIRYANTAALREVVQDRMEKLGYDPRDIAGKSEGRLSHQTVYALIAARTSTVYLRTLEGLSVALGLDMDELLGCVRDNAPWIWPKRFDTTPLWIRAEIERTVGAMLEAVGIIER